MASLGGHWLVYLGFIRGPTSRLPALTYLVWPTGAGAITKLGSFVLPSANLSGVAGGGTGPLF